MSFLQNLPDMAYCTEMFLSVLIFWLPLEKRGSPVARLLAGIPFFLIESIWISPWLQRAGIHAWFFVVYLTVLGVCLFSSRTSLWEALYCVSCGYLTQHFVSCGYLFLFQMGWIPEEWNTLRWLYPLFFLLVCALFYLLFARGMDENGHYPVSMWFSVIISGTTVIVVYFLSIFTRQLAHFLNVDVTADSYQAMLGICQIYAMIACVLILAMLKLHRNELHAWKTLEKSRTIWDQKRRQYELSKENLDLMNRKYHDMKHHLAAISQMSSQSRHESEYRGEVEEILRISGSYAQTGNEALDTILTENGLYCGTHQIQWSCVADGSLLGFMDAVDLYVMLGNALDNAVESVNETEEPENRYISVSIRKEKEFILFQIRNYMEGELHYREGLPITHKADAENHGFGLRSIRDIAKKYHGTMTITARDHLFQLNILIPLP